MTGPTAPRTFGRYEVLEELGGSATTIDYRARDPALERTVVVRVLVPPSDASESDREAFEARFLAQARHASFLPHPALVTTHDYGKDPVTGALFVVEEHVSGTCLGKVLVPGEPRPWTEALALASQVARALQRLHEAGIVHQDVRPSRLVVLESGACKLAGPGFPHFESSRAIPTAVTEASGEAPLYVSPEQAVGERVDLRSDIFALGALTYRLLTGHDAFEASDAQGILARVVHDPPPPPSRWVPGLPAGIDSVLARALAKARKDRYADAGSFGDDLEDLLAGRAPRNAAVATREEDTWRFLSAASPEPAVGETTGTGWRRPDRRHAVRSLVGLVALALVAGLELLRRDLEAPSAPPVGPPAPDVPARPDDAAGPGVAADLPSIESPPPPAGARLSIDFKHTLENGVLVVRVDGVTVVERKVSGAVTKRFLGIKLREGSLRQVVEVSPGRHSVSVRVRWGDEERSDTISGTFAAGTTRRLSAKVGRIGRRLSIEWQ